MLVNLVLIDARRLGALSRTDHMRISREYFQVAAEVGQAIIFLLYSHRIFKRIRLLNTEMESDRRANFLIFSMAQLILNDVLMKH